MPSRSAQAASPAVSVIVATYNCASTLALSLSSLLAQDFHDFEAWVVGDACTDNSEAIVESLRDPRLHWINLPRNSGSQAAPNNEGLSRARGRFIAFLGHDDLWFPWHLSDLASALERSGADLAHSLGAVLDAAGPCAASGPPPGGVSYRDHFVPPSTWMHRRELARLVGPWNDPATLGCGVDFDFSRRAALAGATFVFAGRLSVLKFPSANFRLYAAPGGGPQRDYWELMQRDAGALERKVLTELAASMASHPQQWLGRIGSDRESLVRQVVVSVRRRAVDPWRDTWFAKPILRWLFQRKRRRVRRLRGLKP